MSRQLERSLLLLVSAIALAGCYKLSFPDYEAPDAPSSDAASASEAGSPAADAPSPITSSDSTGALPGAGGSGTGGAVSASGGAGGNGGVIAAGGAGGGGTTGRGGALGTGGATSAGGSPGTGGTSAPTCIPPCASGFTCCEGSDQRCDGTRLPVGDGTNSGQFVVSSDDLTVTDTITGLEWQRDVSGTYSYSWAGAKAYCAGLTLGGRQGWRLPGVMELSTIVDFAVTSGATIDATAFPNTPAYSFWTSSPLAGVPGSAWYVIFYNGGSGNGGDVSDGLRVRCVR